MKIKIGLIIIMISIILFVIYYIGNIEGYSNYSNYNNYHNYNEIDRIKLSKGKYGYCIAGDVQCISGNLIEIDDNYNGGTTYKRKCDNFAPVECRNNFQYKYNKDDLDWNTPTARNISFPFSDKYKGFTTPYSYIPVEISGNYIQFYDSSGNLIDSMNKCDMLESQYLSDQCYDALNPEEKTKTNSKKCIANYGTSVGDSLCCGQKGVLQKYASNYVCPKSTPTCSDFVCGKSYGTCK